MDLSNWPSGNGYLLSHSSGLPPLSAESATSAQLFGPLRSNRSEVWNRWLEAVGEFRAALAEVINHDAAMICPQPSVSAGLTQVLGALPPVDGRRKLLIAERAFPSLGFVFSVAQRAGFELTMVPREENTQNPETWAKYLDDQVHCVLFTHVHSNTSECHDIAALCEVARASGAISVVDVAQSIGIRAVDARAWHADFIVGSCLKWLCGGSGAGFLWVHPDQVARCEPRDVGWFSHRDPFEFDIHHFEYADDALRFWGGTPSAAPAIVANHSIRALLELGLPAVRAHNRQLTDHLVAQVDAECLTSPAVADQRGGTVVLNLKSQHADFVGRLASAGLEFDERKEGVRLSPHLYNTLEDMERILACVPAEVRR
ncbi:MAG: aminotransferase class V-fold PLP-dependent enzyme [Pseudomonadota bacterium]